MVPLLLSVKGRNSMTLDGPALGAGGIVRAVRCGEPLHRHLLEMGLTPGTAVTLVRRAPWGSPLELRVRSCTLTLRREDARAVELYDPGTAPKKTKHSVSIPATLPPRTEADTRKMPDGKEKSEKNEKYERSEKPEKPEKPLRLALLGIPNCGKTTLFNRLTGAHQHVGNFPGVTVERRDGVVRGHDCAVVTDLPGVCSLFPYSGEETVTRDFLLGEKPDGIFGILDASDMERSLYLAMQIIELGFPTVFALNRMDEMRGNGGTVSVGFLEAALGVPVIPVSAATGEGIPALIERALCAARNGEIPRAMDLCAEGDAVSRAVRRAACAVSRLIGGKAEQAHIPVRFAVSGLLMGDTETEKRLFLTQIERDALCGIRSALERESGTDCVTALVGARYAAVDALCEAAVTKPRESRQRVRSDRIDRVLTGRYTALPAFFLLMGAVFFLTFSAFGARLSAWMKTGLDAGMFFIDEQLARYGVSPVVRSLVIEGIFGGVGAVLQFLPMLLTLFFFLSVLEDSGYLARAAFLADAPMRRLGLSGRSFVPLLLGFGCSVPAILASRTLPSERDRRMTVLLIPFMSCSAKLPVYTLFSSVFFPEHPGIAAASLYGFGILAAILWAAVLRRTVFRGDPAPFVLELPDYRFPRAGNVLRLLWEKGKDFLGRAFTVIVAASVTVWFLQRFDPRLRPVTDARDSLLAWLGGALLPLFRPLGFHDWRVPTALLAGLTAKESIVSTLTVLLGSPDCISALFTTSSACAFLVFCLLYTPCAAAAAAVRRELGTKTAFFAAVVQCAIAWLCAFFVRMLTLIL